MKLHLGDCLDVLRTLPDGCVDAVVTDPPYGMRANLNSRRFSGGKARSKRRFGEGRDDWPAIAGDDRPFDPGPWLGFPKVILWGSNHFAARLPVGTTLVWVKKADHHFGTFLSDAEIAWQKGGHGVYCYRQTFMGAQRGREAGGTKAAHPTQKPVALGLWCMERLKLKPGDTVFDPYMGSGSFGVAAVQLGLNYIGCELNPAYLEIARRRIESARAQTLSLNTVST